MKIIHQEVKLIHPQTEEELLRKIEEAGRVCYKSEDKITNISSKSFVKGLLKNNHLSVLEHASITVKITTDRGVSHELVRHRIASYSQESTRYVKYKKEIEFVYPIGMKRADTHKWTRLCERSEKMYHDMINEGTTPEQARSVLPNSLKTEIVMTANIREWLHIIPMRISKKAHPQMRHLMLMVLDLLFKHYPSLFGHLHHTHVADNFTNSVKAELDVKLNVVGLNKRINNKKFMNEVLIWMIAGLAVTLIVYSVIYLLFEKDEIITAKTLGSQRDLKPITIPYYDTTLKPMPIVEIVEVKQAPKPVKSVAKPVLQGNVGLFKSYMPYHVLKNQSTLQYKLQQEAYTDSSGFRRLKTNDDYLVALGSGPGRVGERFEITLSSGKVFTVTKGDEKSDRHTDAQTHTICNSNGSVIEFIVDIANLLPIIKKMGNASYGGFEGYVTSIRKLT